MASTEGPQPKRRRTEDAHMSEASIPQAEYGSIAQANSTLNIFMGPNSRQHRWMSGYVSEPRDTQVPGQTQAPAPSTRAVSYTQPPQTQQPPSTRTASTSAATTRAGTSNLVNYELPATSAPMPSNAPPMVTSASRKSMDRIPSGGATVGLPSPVSSDGTMNSPATMHVFEATAPRRGRPPNDARNSLPSSAVLQNNGSPVARAHAQMQPPLPPVPRGQQHSRSEHPAYAPPPRAMHLPSNAATAQGPQMVHSHPHVVPQAGKILNGVAGLPNWKQMFQQLDLFEKNILPKLGNVGHVDAGRITLLHEAIEKGDWFYICLSQIHCLTATPSMLPPPANNLSYRAITYLDMLLCPNNKLNPTVLQWLSDFPFAIQNIYSSPARPMYEKLIHDVVEFVQRLPTGWDTLVDECKKLAAPPLMDDLLDSLGVRSPVLQTTVFRAIARMIKEGSDPLETLHRMDQEAFARGRLKRTTQERAIAYQAFRETINKLKVHEQLPIELRKRFNIPPQAIAVFQVKMPPTPTQPRSMHPNHFDPAQRQQAAHLNNQQTSHVRQPSNAGTNLHPGPSKTPPIVLFGNIPMPRQQKLSSRQLIFPHETEQPRAQPTHPDTMRSALHQAHLRSPILTHTGLANPRLYRHVTGFALPPRRINKALPIETVQFDIPQELYDALPATLPPMEVGAPYSRSLNEKTRTLRLRCVSGAEKALESDSKWMEADNYWPDNLFLTCNGRILEARRKLHHNRYLPIDLTTIVKPGPNNLEILVNRMSTDTRPYDYGLAIEIVGLTAHGAIATGLKKLSAQESLAAIKASLSSSSSADDDDDIAVTSSTTTISLFDPHTLTKIFDTPVRGAACLHKDCFDLEIFLSQRDPKHNPGVPSIVDCWRCPICRGDVRPQTLVRDGFMDEVRRDLERKGLLDTRQIVVEEDGRWRAKVEELGEGVRSPSLEGEEPAKRVVEVAVEKVMAFTTAAGGVPRGVEVIELD